LLRLDPLCEAMYLRLMQLHAARCASTTSARRRCTKSWRPSPIHACARYTSVCWPLRRRHWPPLAATALVCRVPLVGRTVEWTRVLATWQAAAGGRLLTLVGEPGIGKTRLAGEVLAWAGRQGIGTASARCYAALLDLGGQDRDPTGREIGEIRHHGLSLGRRH
jgi:AAA ATPase domain